MPFLCFLQWWFGELERGYVLHRARALHEQHTAFAPLFKLTARLTGIVNMPLHPCFHPRLRPLPTVQLVQPRMTRPQGG